jgi:hypothetical protein
LPNLEQQRSRAITSDVAPSRFVVPAYPTADVADLDCVARQRALGKRIVLMVDDAVQLQPLIARARAFGIVFLVAMVTRCPTEGVVTCLGGGYVASGRAGRAGIVEQRVPTYRGEGRCFL